MFHCINGNVIIADYNKSLYTGVKRSRNLKFLNFFSSWYVTLKTSIAKIYIAYFLDYIVKGRVRYSNQIPFLSNLASPHGLPADLM